MGKHDKKVEPATPVTIAGVDNSGFYKERIKKLDAENKKLKEELNDTQHNLAVMTSLYEQGAERLVSNEARSDEIIERKNEEIEMAKEAIYLAAMREVSMR